MKVNERRFNLRFDYCKIARSIILTHEVLGDLIKSNDPDDKTRLMNAVAAASSWKVTWKRLYC